MHLLLQHRPSSTENMDHILNRIGDRMAAVGTSNSLPQLYKDACLSSLRHLMQLAYTNNIKPDELEQLLRGIGHQPAEVKARKTLRGQCEQYLGVNMHFSTYYSERFGDRETATVVEVNTKSVVLDHGCADVGPRSGIGSEPTSPDIFRFRHRLFLRRILEGHITPMNGKSE